MDTPASPGSDTGSTPGSSTPGSTPRGRSAPRAGYGPRPPDGAQPGADAELGSRLDAGAGFGPEPGGRDRVTELFARALEDDPGAEPAARARDDASHDAFRELIERGFAGDSTAERACQALLDVLGDRAEADGTMITDERFRVVVERAIIAGQAWRDQDQAFERDGFFVREDGTVGFGDPDADDFRPEGP